MYTPQRKKQYIEAKYKLLDNAKKIYSGREKLIEEFKNKIFPLNYDGEKEKKSRYKEEHNNIRGNNGFIDYKRLNKLINLRHKQWVN